MPAASFVESPIGEPAPAIWQSAIGPKQCRWIVADEEAGAEALMCGAPAVPHGSFCAEHRARAYLPVVEDEATEAVAAKDPEEEEEAE